MTYVDWCSTNVILHCVHTVCKLIVLFCFVRVVPSEGDNSGLIAGVTVGVILCVVVLIIVIVVVVRRRKRKFHLISPSPPPRRLCFASVYCFVCLPVNKTIFEVMNRFYWNFERSIFTGYLDRDINLDIFFHFSQQCGSLLSVCDIPYTELTATENHVVNELRDPLAELRGHTCKGRKREYSKYWCNIIILKLWFSR